MLATETENGRYLPSKPNQWKGTRQRGCAGQGCVQGPRLAWGDFARVRCRNTKQSAFRVLFYLFLISFPNMKKKNKKYENSAIALLNQTLITASVLCFLLILFLVVCKLATETPANRFLKKKKHLKLPRPRSVPFSILLSQSSRFDISTPKYISYL